MTPGKVNTADALIQAALRGELTEAQARQLYDHGREVVAFAFAAAARRIAELEARLRPAAAGGPLSIPAAAATDW